MLHVMSLILGATALFFGVLLVFFYKQFHEMSLAVNKILFDENQVARYRVGIGLVLIGASVLVLIGSQYLKAAGY